jgi:hypothetical protein
MRVLVVEGDPSSRAPQRAGIHLALLCRPGQAPAAEGRFDAGTQWWHSSTVDQWQASRPRRRP